MIAFGIGEDWRAYPIQILVWHEIVNDVVADVPVVDGRTLTFERGEGGTMRDTETGSSWSFDGRATSGELAGEKLELLVADSPFWFAWAVFRPDTRVWQP